MRLNPPKKITSWISILVALIGFVVYALTFAGVLGLAWLGLVVWLQRATPGRRKTF